MNSTTLTAALLLAVTGCVVRDPLPNPSGPVGPPQVADFTLPLYPSKQPHDIKSDRGSVVLLDVWATWCEPCRDALPIYEALAKEYGPRGLKVYAINVDEDVREVPRFVAETRLSLPILLDEKGTISERVLKVSVMPTTYFIDRKGKIRHIHAGFAEEALAQYQAELEQLLAERE
jgi:cytochrome c biogenesis protein CcmG, thiol:disulfide interchange protein DsbE